MTQDSFENPDWGIAPAGPSSESGPTPLQPSKQPTRLRLVLGALGISFASLAGGFVWGNLSGRSEQHSHDTAGFKADQLIHHQDLAKMDAILKIAQAGIRNVIGLHFGSPHNTLYATVSTARPGTKGGCQEDFVYSTTKDGNSKLTLKLTDASGQHTFADIVINGPISNDAAVKQIEANHPNGC